MIAAAETRRWLPNRRCHELLSFEHGGIYYTAGFGRFENGDLAEIFLNTRNKLPDRIAQWMKMVRPRDLPPRALMVNLSVRLRAFHEALSAAYMDELRNERRAQIEKAAASKASGKAARGRPNSNLSGTVEPGGRIGMT
jgi:hypothetical protein